MQGRAAGSGETEQTVFMKSVEFDGRVRRPMKLAEGMQPGTVEWERLQVQRREEAQRFREIQQQQEFEPKDVCKNIPTTYSSSAAMGDATDRRHTRSLNQSTRPPGFIPR